MLVRPYTAVLVLACQQPEMKSKARGVWLTFPSSPPEKMELLYETAFFEESHNNLQLDGYGFLEANSREKYELLIDGIDGLTAADHDSLKHKV